MISRFPQAWFHKRVPMREDAIHQAWRPEFSLWDPHDVKRELIPKDCLLGSVEHMYTDMHITVIQFNIFLISKGILKDQNKRMSKLVDQILHPRKYTQIKLSYEKYPKLLVIREMQIKSMSY